MITSEHLLELQDKVQKLANDCLDLMVELRESNRNDGYIPAIGEAVATLEDARDNLNARVVGLNAPIGAAVRRERSK